MIIEYVARFPLEEIFDPKILKGSCRLGEQREVPTCLLRTGVPHSKDDRKILEKKLVKNCLVYKFRVSDLPDPRRSTVCSICGKCFDDLPTHLEKTHGLYRWHKSKVMEEAYHRVVLPLLRCNLWAIYPAFVGGCPLCGNKALRKLEDGSPHEWPWRCVRFESARSKFWDIRAFGIEPKLVDRVIGNYIHFFIIGRKEDQCRINPFVKKFRLK